MWELIVNIVGWVVGGSLEARAGAINKKAGKISSENDKQIAEILGSAQAEAAKEETKQALLNSATVNYKSKAPSYMPLVVFIAVVVTVVFFLVRAGKVDNNNVS